MTSSEVLCINLPSQRLPHNNADRASCNIDRPVLTIENIDGKYFVSARFKIIIAVVPRRFRPWDSKRYIRRVVLRYPDDPQERADKAPSSQFGHAFHVTTGRTITSAAGVAFNAPTPPSGSVNLSLTWSKAITVERTVDRWTITAVPDPERTDTFRWEWVANIPDGGSLQPSDLSGSAQWCVSVKRRLPDNTNLMDFIKRPFKFDLEVNVETLASRTAAFFRRIFARHNAHRENPVSHNFCIEIPRNKRVDGNLLPESSTIDIETALQNLKHDPEGGEITIPAVFPALADFERNPGLGRLVPRVDRNNRGLALYLQNRVAENLHDEGADLIHVVDFSS
ncbi:hypothetical protein BDV24DRAFT_170066 [Aspergillus arachidicola]|uniref:Uncharacterized protein n=1 Tax=Aspergillus arachidicola TaxID=656916 RepID=A0A5N6XST6_9EURO|nr:hypothetical protein BDV24DRAFT_170066 [Aspergillus arachidicola]